MNATPRRRHRSRGTRRWRPAAARAGVGRPDGQPIVLIHGWSQNHLCWAHQYDSALADEFRLVAFDLRGHGMSDAPLDAAHYTDATLWADDLAAVIEALDLPRTVLVGWSSTVPSSSWTTSAGTDQATSPPSTSSKGASSSMSPHSAR